MDRRLTRKVCVGNKQLGGGSPILIQSMTNTKTADIKATAAQIQELQKVGCEMVRVAVSDYQEAASIAEIKKQIKIPLVADIQWNYRLALVCIENGIDKIRLNPGILPRKEQVTSVVKACKERNIPIRVGVNSGSVSEKTRQKYGGICAEALIASAYEHIAVLEDLDFRDIVVSLKASDLFTCMEAYQKFSQRFDYPLHIGITEAGTIRRGSIKSAIGIGALLMQGIGDTIRVSLTGNPVEEIEAAKDILSVLKLRQNEVNFVSCPTCSRTEIDLIGIASEVEKRTANLGFPLHIAVMGCPVNGPGEARDADIGIAGGKGRGIIFKKGKVLRQVAEKDLVVELMKEIEGMKAGKKAGKERADDFS